MKMSDVVGFLSDSSEFQLLYKGQKVAFQNEAGRIDENSRFFAAGFEFGAHVIICVESYRGDGYEAAWEAWIDESPTIPEEELIEAHRVDGKTAEEMAEDEFEAREASEGRAISSVFSEEYRARRELVKARAFEILKSREDWDLVEGYEYQSNFTGTGIVNVGHYAWMNEADLDDIEIVRKEENPSE